jgi:hypothetical protein
MTALPSRWWRTSWRSGAGLSPLSASLGGLVLFLGFSAVGPALAETGTVLAQVGPPTLLGPMTGSDDSPGDTNRATDDGAIDGGVAPPPTGEPGLPRTPSGIEVTPLPEARTDYAGVLGAEDGGLGATMWRGTDRALVTRLLPNLPVTTRSPTMQDLTRRLLLSSAEAPAGRGGDENLIALRAERLAAMGRYQDAASLLRLMRERDIDEAAARLTVDALLLANNLDAACSEIDSWIQQFDEEVYWQKALIFCQTRAGQLDEAALGLGLLREQGRVDDDAFYTLVDALSGVEGAAVEALPAPSPLHLAMLRAAGQPVPESILESEDPTILAGVATGPGAEPALRLAAAERAAAVGALPIEDLRRIYADQPIEPAELDAALSLAEKEPGPRSRAALYQAAARVSQAVARATILQKALELALQNGVYPVAVQVNLPFLTELTPAPELAWFALDAGRALYFAGRHELADSWRLLAQEEASRDPEAATAASALWLLARIAGMGDQPLVWDAASVAAWRDHQAAGGDDHATQRAARLFAVLEALDEPVGAAWQVLADGAPPDRQTLPDAALWFILGDAADAGRVGETVLLALISLGRDGPAMANPIILSRVLSSLRAIGFEAEARALGLEAAIASGV